MYAHHNTDNPEVLPCNRNNCRCGNDTNCMYYNNDENGHYNYVAVQGTGDKHSPGYNCPSLAYDVFNQEKLYGDDAAGNLGAYNDLSPYGGVNDPKGWYGPAPLSYPEKPTCGGYKNSQVQEGDDNHDYDKWDRYHEYRKFQNGNAPVMMAQGPNMFYGVSLTNMLLAVGGAIGLWFLVNNGTISKQVAIVAVTLVLVLFFLRMMA